MGHAIFCLPTAMFGYFTPLPIENRPGHVLFPSGENADNQITWVLCFDRHLLFAKFVYLRVNALLLSFCTSETIVFKGNYVKVSFSLLCYTKQGNVVKG